ncbi:hypothetical protein [Streptomyces sp. NPDC006368]|uniref:hypothetical protein n=1 Tax=Streptomyces sp. NPDC006368 TaxID=3156760 RepID=UPI00339E5F0B
MIKQVLATAGLAAVVLGAAASQASAVGDHGVQTMNGNNSVQSYGNTGPDDGAASTGGKAPEGALPSLNLW